MRGKLIILIIFMSIFSNNANAYYYDLYNQFTDNLDGTVTDLNTGLMWEVKGSKDGIQDYSNPNDADNTYHCQESGYPYTPISITKFINDLNSINYAGYDDWRMPTIEELASIMDTTKYIPAIDTSFFPNIQSDSNGRYRYWSSTEDLTSNPSSYIYQFYLIFNLGSPQRDVPYGLKYVRAVRGNKIIKNFVNNGDGTVTETTTGMMWAQKTNDNGVNSANNRYNFYQAVNWARNLILNNDGEWTHGTANLSGSKYDDWRLPNFFELQSILAYIPTSPVVDIAYFPNTQIDHYWTSTFVPNLIPGNKVVNFERGTAHHKLVEDHPFNTPNPQPYARAVRTGEFSPLGDFDSNGMSDATDNCPFIPNYRQKDVDNDGLGDVCDADTIHGYVSGDVQYQVNVTIYQTLCGASTTYASTVTDYTGYYAIGNVENGRYLVGSDYAGYSFAPGGGWVDIPQEPIQSYGFISTAD